MILDPKTLLDSLKTRPKGNAMPENTECTSPEHKRLADVERALHASIAELNLRIDHVIGWHDTHPRHDCKSCMARHGAHPAS